MFKTLENGGVGHLQIRKKKGNLGQKAHVTQKPPNLLYLANPTFFGETNSITSFKTLENGGVCPFKTFKMFHNDP
jgi:hypothetical protein